MGLRKARASRTTLFGRSRIFPATASPERPMPPMRPARLWDSSCWSIAEASRSGLLYGMVNPYESSAPVESEEIVQAELAGSSNLIFWITIGIVLYLLCGAFAFMASYAGRW